MSEAAKNSKLKVNKIKKHKTKILKSQKVKVEDLLSTTRTETLLVSDNRYFVYRFIMIDNIFLIL